MLNQGANLPERRSYLVLSEISGDERQTNIKAAISFKHRPIARN